MFGPSGATQDAPLKLWVKGTNFQIKVWEALLRVPFGGLASYGGLARAMGRPDSARAVGGAIADNPVAYLIPCHRVIRSSGRFETDYRWGTARKRAMIGWEAANALADEPFGAWDSCAGPGSGEGEGVRSISVPRPSALAST